MAEHIKFDEFMEKKEDSFYLIDIRDKESFDYGHLKNAINLKENEIAEFAKEKNLQGKEIVVYCKNGFASQRACERLSKKGIDALYIEGGYFEYLRRQIDLFTDSGKKTDIEKSLQKKFRKNILTKFLRAIKQYELIKSGDKIAVCISGGKDSFLLAKLFQELLRFTEIPFEVVYLVMDPGYSSENREIIEKNAKMLGIPIHIFETNIFDSVFNIEDSPCYLCARMRRGYLYNEARKYGCNKIALGHHFDDVIETTLMGMLYGAQIQTMMPKLHSTNFEDMELIRPMYLIHEEDIKHWRDYNGLYFLQCACKFTEQVEMELLDASSLSSKRKKVKQLIASLKKEDPQIDQNIFKSIENVNLSTVVAYKDKSGNKHNFLEDYDNSQTETEDE